jgi:anti-sigma-K factor RskA
MDKASFLESGLLEQYALGIVTPAEEREVEAYLEEFPELREELEQMRQAMETYALSHAIPPPTDAKNQVIKGIEALEKQAMPAPSTQSGLPSWLIAACLTALCIACGLSLWQINNLQQDKQVLVESLDQCSRSHDQYALISDPSTRPIQLQGSANAPSASALVYWNPSQKKALLNAAALPPLAANEQYQIWADVDHVMLSLGTIDKDQIAFQTIKFLDKATSLNITIEPLGGSKAPHVDRLVANRAI